MKVTVSPRARIAAVVTALVVILAALVGVPQAATAGPSTVTTNFGYTGSTSSFTVPPGITALTLTVTGAQGGNGGADATPAPPNGGYQGVVTGVIAVTSGQILTIGVGGGGATGASRVNSSAGNASAGANPISGFGGGRGGAAGANGSSGAGGAGGAASVVQIAGNSIVAGGGGGNGGSGQYASTQGRVATSTFFGRTDTVTGAGQAGINANDACTASSCSNNDGGGSGGGGGGSLGGGQGPIEFGAGSSNEWFGYGGSVGQNSTASISGLSASYQYYSTNGGAGSVSISYTTGSPAAPSAVTGTPGNGSVTLAWTAPTDPGQSGITDYVAQYSSNSGSSWSSAFDLSTTSTNGTVTGLVNGTAYIFQIAAVNSVGTGVWSASSAPITPLGPPSAPTISLVTAQDGALGLTLSAPSSGAPVTGYDYRLNGGSWVAVPSPSTSIVIPGLVNGTSYTVEVRAESAVGAGTVSAPASGTPLAVPGAPTISSLSVGNNSLGVSFTPGFSGGGTITSYQYQLNGGSWVTASGTTSPISITGLTAGTSYSVALRAVNSVGAGAASAPASASTPSAPGAPNVSSVVAGDGSVTVTFTPGTTGGSPLTGYQYQLGSGGQWFAASTSASPLVIPGLSNGTSYLVSIRAVNAVGNGAASAPLSATPATTPSAPSIVGNTVASGNGTLSAAFTAPSSDGGSAIVSYQYSTDAGANWRDRTDGGSTASPVVISTLSSDGTSALAAGTTYYVELRAVNGVGAGTASAVASGIATTAPTAPVISTVTTAPQSLAVTFAAGANGGSAITSYEYSTDGSTWTGTGTLGTSFIITGLTNGQSYPVRVRALNGVGTGTASAAVNGTPVALPGQPVISGVVRSNQTLTTSVTLADNGGSAVTSWQYSTDAGATWATASGTTSPLTLTRLSSNSATPLANGTGYAVQVRAVTAVGTGPASATTIVAPAAAPSAPSIALTQGNGSVSVAFSLGTDGGSPVTQLEYSLDGGTTWISTGTLSSPFTISGLTNGTAYGVLLRADNAIGTGTPSVSASTTPRTVPDAPTSVVAVSNTASANVSWTAPSFNGGSVITGYTVSAYATLTSTTPISTCMTSGATSCTVTTLANGTAYYIAVTGTNAAGTGSASTPRVLVTPLVRPSAPTLSSLTAGDGTLSVAFTPGAAGDRSIASYQYSIDGGSTWQAASGTTSPILLTGLTNGTAYTVALRAVSTAGVGATSNTLSATPYTYPSAPDATTIVANGGNGQVTVSWAAANLNGGTLLNYTATAFSALTGGSTSNYCTTATLSCAITGLSNGTTYYISLQTQNSANMFSPRSAPRVAATPSLQPGAPTAVAASAGDASATVTWTAPTSTGASAISGYQVYCSANGGSYTLCATLSSPTPTSTTVTSLTNGSSYTFQVYAVNSNGTGPVSAASSAVTPLGAGVAPTFGAVTRTATGFTTTISNYDASTSYTGVGSNGANVGISGQNVTVTNLTNGASSHVTITAAKSARTNANASVDGAALLTGITPTFSGNLANGSGFTFTITNFDAAASYSLSATSGTVVRTGSSVQVTGLLLGGTSTVHVTVSKAGSTDGAADDAGAAMVVGTAPTFANLVTTDTGFQVDIANYNSGLSYTFSLPVGVSATRSGSTVTVTGLSNGASADLTVIATNPNVSQASAVQNGTALLSGVAPTVSAVTSTTQGFAFTITDVDPLATYTVTTSAGGYTLVNGLVTVTGLNPGESATVTITAAKTGYVTTQTQVTAAALQTGITPLFAAPVRTADGFSFAISNFDSAGSYVLSSSAGTAALAGSTVTVTGLAANAAATVTVTVSHSGYTDAVGTQSGTALAAGTAPVFGSVVPTADGFTFAITNYNSALDYGTSLVPSTGLVVLNSDGTGTVSGEAAGVAVTLTVTATDPGVSIASGSTGATVLVPGVTPVLSASTPVAGGYTFTITNYDSSQSYSFVQSAGGTVVRSGSTVTVSGLSAGVTSNTQVTAARAGFLSASAAASGTSFPSGNAPAVSAITRTLDGFTFELTLDPGSTYSVSSDAGTVTLNGTTVTVTGLGAGATTTVHITVSAPGVLDEVADVAGTAINPGIAPTFSTPVSATGGFVVTIANYSSAFDYVLSTSAGTVTRNGDHITVAGLAAGASATVSVVATQNGYRDASGSLVGSAVAATPSPATPPAPPVPTPVAPTVISTPVSTNQTAPGGPSDVSSLTSLHESKAGEATITSGGAALSSKLATTHTTVSVSTVAGLKLTVAAQRNGATIPLASDGVVEVDRSGQLWVTVTGLAPQSLVTMWSMSRTLELGTAHTDQSGWAGNRILLPRELTRGVHTLVVTGVSDDGTPVTMQVGFRVLDPHPTAAVTPASSGTWAIWVIAALILLVLGMWFVVWRRRRRDNDDREILHT